MTEPGFITRAVTQQNHRFTSRTLLINNVADRDAASERAQAAVDRGEIDDFAFVDDHVDAALRIVRLTKRDFGRYLHWSDCCVVALTMKGPDLLCYVDVDLELRGSGDWIEHALEVFAEDPRVGVANPNWRMADGSTSVEAEADERGPGWLKGYGFTDQIFLCRRSTFARPLMPRIVPLAVSCPVSLRYFGQQLMFGTSTLFFEQVIDSFMRRNRILRLTLTSREFEPVPMSSYPSVGFEERVAARLTRTWLSGLQSLRDRFPNWITSPRVRMTGLLDPQYRRD